LLLVSEEESGGEWGAKWMVENVPSVVGDLCINAEPRSLNIGIGQKGLCFVKIKARGKPAHGSRSGYMGDNAILKIFNTRPILEKMKKTEGKLSPEGRKLLEMTSGSDRERYDMLNHISVNISVIRGGSKVNIVPGVCELEVDMRLPIGVTPQEVFERLKQELRVLDPSVTCEYLWNESVLNEANYTSPDEKLCKTYYENTKTVTSIEPQYIFTPGFNDCRFFRQKGVPSINFGPTGDGMAMANEYVTIDSLVNCTKIHSASVAELLLNGKKN
jgi:succinyl-diaminopimelate desuccinylase